MNDLISRQALIEDIEEKRPLNWTDSESEIQEQSDWDYFVDMVKSQPVAYDTDKVVEQLEKQIEVKEAILEESVSFMTIGELRSEISVLDKAIEIVKAGGVDG